MFELDLLKNEKPPKLSLLKCLYSIFIVLMFIGMTAVFALAYLDYSDRIDNANNTLEQLNSRMAELETDKQFTSKVEVYTTTIKVQLTELSKSLKRHVQWSPILLTMVQEMPESVTLQKMEVQRRSSISKVKDEANGNKLIDVEIIERTLKSSVLDSGSDEEATDIRNFVNKLKSDQSLIRKITEVRTASIRDAQNEKSNVKEYEIDCLFN